MSATYAAPVPKPALWTGRVVSCLVIAFLFFDAIIKVLKLEPAVEGTARLGYPAGVVFPLGIVLLVCVILCCAPSFPCEADLPLTPSRMSRRGRRPQGSRSWARRWPSVRSRPAPSPRHALPCMQASVVGSRRARRSSMARAFTELTK
jgi:DoxX-like family